jgi:hypothetical protein
VDWPPSTRSGLESVGDSAARAKVNLRWRELIADNPIAAARTLFGFGSQTDFAAVVFAPAVG